MKKKWIHPRGKSLTGIPLIVRIMKLVTLFLFVAVMHVAAATYSQTTRLTIVGQNLTVGDILDRIENQSEYSFFFNANQIDLSKRISIDADKQLVSKILDEILAGSGLTYTVNNKLIVIHKPGEADNIFSSQQTNKISGKVIDSSGLPLPGVTVVVKGTTNGTITNVDGLYSLSNVPSGAIIAFSFVGMKTEEILMGTKTVINVTLTEESIGLDEVVAVGYGTVKKSDVTGAVTRISEETLKERPVSNILQAMQGKAAGIDITSNIKPGELPQITIRGNRSISASNSPLYVVDGIPFAAGTIADINPTDIASVEILKDASATAIYGSRGANGVILITTKKGEKGKVTISYDGTYSLDSYKSLTDWMNGGEYVDRWRLGLMNGGLYGTEKFTNLNTPVQPGYPDPNIDISKFGLAADPVARESVLMGYEWEGDIGGTVKKRTTTAEEKAMGWPDQVPVYNSKNVRSFDWRNEAMRQGINQNHQLSLSSGNDISRIYISFAVVDQVGVQKDQDYQRYNVNLNGEITPQKWITIGTSINASMALQNFGIQAPNTSNTGSKDLYSRTTDQFPYALPKDADGNWIKNPGGNLSLWNPLIDIDQSLNERRSIAIYSNMFSEIRFTPWLKYRLNFGAQFRKNRSGAWTGPNATSHLTNSPRTASYDDSERFTWVLENLLYFNKKIGTAHDLGLTLLQSSQQFRQEGINISATSMISDIALWYDIASNTNGKPNGYSTSFTENKLMSYMGRVNYALHNKYLITATGRWDGASVLAPGNKWDFFPSFSAAWKMQEENFMKDFNFVNEFKVRAGYGVTGNAAVAPYTTSGPLSRNPYMFLGVPGIGYLPQQVANPSLGWEKTAQYNIGLDFGFINNRITGSIELYKSKTSDLLLNKSLPAVSGFVSKIENIGKTMNKGIEITLNTVNIKTKDFQWSSTINWSANREEIVELLNKDADGKALSMLANRWFIGYPIQVYYNYQNDGIWQNTDADKAEMAKFNANGHKFYPGTIKVVDQKTIDTNGDGVKDAGNYKITGDDMVILGSNRPKWTGGVTNSFSYKNFELSFFVFARIGQKYFGGYPNSYGGVNPNGRVENNVWSWTNPNGRWPMPNLGNKENLHTSMQYNNGSYVSVRNISLTYNFPANMLRPINMSRLSVFGQVINPFMFGGDVVKMGLNPEDNTNWDVASSNGNPLGGMNNNTIQPQSFVFGIRASF
jgi:TonB-linked SusC/RagA family outer membrane protein